MNVVNEEDDETSSIDLDITFGTDNSDMDVDDDVDDEDFNDSGYIHYYFVLPERVENEEDEETSSINLDITFGTDNSDLDVDDDLGEDVGEDVEDVEDFDKKVTVKLKRYNLIKMIKPHPPS